MRAVQEPAQQPPVSRRRRRLLALGIGLLASLLALELLVRVAWRALVRKDEQALQRGAALGPALLEETLGAHVERIVTGAWPFPLEPLYVPDAQRGFRLRPGVEVQRVVAEATPAERRFTVRTDARGLRGRERPDPPAGAPRVLVVGDSMTFGEGVEDDEAFPARLEALLGGDARVWNAGVVSYGPIEEAVAVRELAPALAPDVVVLQVTVATDPTDALRWREVPAPGARLVPDPEAAAPLAASGWLTNPLASLSATYRLLAWRCGRPAGRYGVLPDAGVLDRCAGFVALPCAAAGPRPVVVLLAPTVAQVERSPLDRILGTRAINAGLRERLAARGIEVVDPLLDLEGTLGLYLPVDRHWTPAGHEAIARALLPVIRRLAEGRPR
jgi:hypothetical protein